MKKIWKLAPLCFGIRFNETEEVEMMRKTGKKGPADVGEKTNVRIVLKQPSIKETCFNFAQEHNQFSKKLKNERREWEK